MKKTFGLSMAGGMSRRGFLKLSSVCSLAVSARGSAPRMGRLPAPSGAGNCLNDLRRSNAGSRPYKTLPLSGMSPGNAPLNPTTIREFLASLAPTRKEVETFLDPKQPNWAKFDSQLGYTLRDNILKDGVDGSRTLTSYRKTGERTIVNYVHKPCRINTYGDSFTQCHQVSDGETWQEHLAAHLGEPIRNFGIGGYGTYQAYRRMLRHEATGSAVEYVMLNIWDLDDYLRSIDAWRWLRIASWFRIRYLGHLYMFQANPWVHVRLDLKTGELIEKENAFATPESLYRLAEPEFVYEHFKDDLVVKLLAAQNGATDIDREELASLAKLLNVKADLSSLEATAETARALHTEYALRAGMKVIEKAQGFARAHHKKMMILLSFGESNVIAACEARPRFDQSVVDFLKEKNIPFVDSLEKHARDFQSFKVSAKEYAKRYYIGHYNPRGNQFFAFAIKEAVVNWLDPKPLAYREGSETIPAVV